MVNSECKAIARDQGDTQQINNEVTGTILIDSIPGQTVDECTDKSDDGRRYNRSSAIRCTHNIVFKYKHIVVYQSWMDEQKQDCKPHSIINYCRNIFLENRIHYWMNNFSRWNNEKDSIIEASSS